MDTQCLTGFSPITDTTTTIITSTCAAVPDIGDTKEDRGRRHKEVAGIHPSLFPTMRELFFFFIFIPNHSPNLLISDGLFEDFTAESTSHGQWQWWWADYQPHKMTKELYPWAQLTLTFRNGLPHLGIPPNILCSVPTKPEARTYFLYPTELTRP